MTYATFLEDLLQDAAELALSFPRQLPHHVKENDPNQVVTAADLRIGSLLKQRILQEFPEDSVIDEESAAISGTSPVTWVIDPVDGTSNFAVGSPLYGVMAGVLRHGEPVAGGVALPALSEIYVAERGRGAHLNGERLGIPENGDLTRQLVAYGMDIHPEEIALDCRIVAGIAARCRGIRMSNSIFDCMMVAKGAYAGFLHRRNALWDCVAAQVIIEESGGVFSAMDGRALDFRDPRSRTAEVFSLLACGAGVHAALTEAVRQQALG